ARADDAEASWHLGERERASVAEDQLFIELDAGQRARIRTGGDDDMLCLDGILATRDLVAVGALAGEAAAPMEKLDLVLAEKEGDAVVARLHHALLALVHLREVELEALHLDAVLGELVAGLLVILRGLQQRLGRDAADIGAGAAERRLAICAAPVVEAGGREAKLCRADRGNVAARAAPDHHHIEARHARSPGSGEPDLRVLP